MDTNIVGVGGSGTRRLKDKRQLCGCYYSDGLTKCILIMNIKSNPKINRLGNK